MTIDLLSPFWGGLAVGIILLNVAGVLKFAVISMQKKAAEDHISNLISEIYSLHKKYKDEIAEIQKRNEDESQDAVDRAFNAFITGIDILLEHNKPPQGFKVLLKEHKNLLERSSELEQKIEKLESKQPVIDIKRGRFFDDD
ncbi:MAG: hypothetical protein WC539_02430 [Nitrospirota bacterium]